VAKFLSDERQIVGIGIDTPSIDPGTSKVHSVNLNFIRNKSAVCCRPVLMIFIYFAKTFPAHQLLAKKEVFNIENVANLHLIPIETCDLRLFILPLKIVGGTGSPARILAYCNKA
jgi:kynurenine formamidase